jgi:hypothetical protein
MKGKGAMYPGVCFYGNDAQVTLLDPKVPADLAKLTAKGIKVPSKGRAPTEGDAGSGDKQLG